MKKILYMLSIALLGATACNTVKDMPEPMVGNGKVTYVMGINVPGIGVNTRGAMDTQPVIDNIYVAVFGNEGYLNDYAKAEPCNADGSAKTNFSGVQNDQLFYYKVTLTASSSKKYVHVIANGPTKLDFGYDEQLIPNMTTNAGEGAYWTMFELPNGTSEKDSAGHDVVTDDAKAAFSNLKLIRNFAKVEVTNTASNFEMEGYKVFNTPAQGRIVTWKENYQAGTTADPHMDGYYTPYIGGKTGTPMTFLQLQNAGYTPTLATGASLDMSAPTAGGTYENTEQFVFERERTNADNRPYVIVKGKYNGSSTSTFYRLDFTDKDGAYQPIFRNFLYSITINTVVKNGVANPADAQPSNANVSALLETQSLTDLADGTSRILVQYLDKTFIFDEETTVKFQYLYQPDATQAASATTVEHATFQILSDEDLEAAGKPANTSDPAFAPVTSNDTWGSVWNDDDKWQEVELKIAASGDEEKRTTFRLTGTTDEGIKLFRDVTIHVLKKQDFNATYVSGGSDIGNPVTVTLNLNPNLPSSVFPLQVAFEDSNKRLNPSGTDMPAKVVETSMVPGKTDRSYQFVKSISYSDYVTNSGAIQCVFKRISTGSTVLYMSNEYFNDANISIAQ